MRAYYSGSGPSLDVVAVRFAKSNFDDVSWQAGEAGCLAALSDEYSVLYG